MKGDPKVIEYLNKGLRSELTAINQYWLHYRILDNWGLNGLAKKWREEAVEEPARQDHVVVDDQQPVRVAERGERQRGVDVGPLAGAGRGRREVQRDLVP